MEHIEAIGLQIRVLAQQIKNVIDKTAFSGHEDPVTGMQGWIIGYLYRNRDKDIFQRDIQKTFSVRRSTVTGMLQLMEKNGLIVRSSVDWDARLKKIELTPMAMEIHENVVKGIKNAETLIAGTLTEDERKQFMALCKKICEGLKEKENSEE